MEFGNLLAESEALIKHLEDAGYSASYIVHLKVEIRWLERSGSAFDSYEEACRARESETDSPGQKKHYRVMFGTLKKFHVDGALPEGRQGSPLFPRGAYHSLNDWYRSLVDGFAESACERGLAESTVKTMARNCSCFLLAMQLRGRETLADVAEEDVLSFFAGPDGAPALSSAYVRQVARVLESAEGGWDGARRVRELLPRRRSRRRNIQYLQPEEVRSVRSALDGEAGALSLRDRAMGMLMLQTGMRGCDVVALTFDMIDWDREVIRIVQAKTSVPLEIPLPVAAGNAIFDYVELERPDSADGHIFLGSGRPHDPLVPAAAWNATARIHAAAGTRGLGDQRGARLFRHHAATTMISSGIPRPTASAVLGHTDPGSLEHYLYADIDHLRGCALSVASFPVAEGVFDV